MDFVEHLKSSIDIVNVVGQYVQLRRSGSGPRYTGLCPFHTEKTPSFSVHSAHQFYKCFGCGAGGDVLKFVMEIEHFTFYEALQFLAERHGIPLPKRTEYADPESKLRGVLLEMHKLAGEMFQASLNGPGGAEVRAYLKRRNVPRELIEEFALGYSDKSGSVLTRTFEKKGFTPEQMEASGLSLKRQSGHGYFDRFRGRLMFPICNESGKIIAFGGRTLEPETEPKYLNSSETPIYRKSSVLYNLHRAKEGIRKSDRTLLVEGYMDVIGLWGAGVREVVAACGTALTNSQVRALKRHSEKVVVNFDPDAAGANASERSIQILLDEGMRVRVMTLDGGLDPDEYVKQRGPDAYLAKLDAAGSYFHWLADRARTKYDTGTLEGRTETLQHLLPAILRISDKWERVAVADDVAGYIGVEPGLVLEYFRKAARERRDLDKAHVRAPVQAVEELLLKSLIASEEIRSEVVPLLKGVEALRQLGTWRIFQAVFGLIESGRPFRLSELDARLEEQDKNLLASIIFADDKREETTSLEQALACVRRLEAKDIAAHRSELRARVKQAEQAGDWNLALQLAEELGRMGKA